MNVYLLRHGEAGKHSAWQGDDSLRPLTKEGITMMRRQAKNLAFWDLEIDVLISSPFTRAIQTAEIVGSALNLEVIQSDMLASMEFGPAQLGHLINQYTKAKNIMVVGHEPDFSQTISAVIGGADLELHKGGLARIEIIGENPLHGRLIYLLTPEIMGAKG